jgi:hypothetical protein
MEGHFFSNKVVIPTGAKRSGGTCGFFNQQPMTNGNPTLSFVIPSEAEGSAVSLKPATNAQSSRSRKSNEIQS